MSDSILAKLTPSQKRIGALLVLSALGLIADQLFGPSDDPDRGGDVSIAAPLKSGSGQAKLPADTSSDVHTDFSAQTVQLERLGVRKNGHEDDQSSAADITPLFESKSWLPPPPPPTPPPKPQAPPFSYTYMGGLTEEGKRINFFSKGESVLSVKGGDTVDAAFHIDQISETQMTMTYLPLNEKVILVLGQR